MLLLSSQQKELNKSMKLHESPIFVFTNQTRMNPSSQTLVAPSIEDRSPLRIRPLDAAWGYVRWTQTCQLRSVSASPSHTEIRAAGPVLNPKSFIPDYFLFFLRLPCVSQVCSPASKAQTQLDTKSLCPPPWGRAPQTHFTSGSPADPGSPDYPGLS